MKNKTPLIKPFVARRSSDRPAATAGKQLLASREATIVLYKRKKWDLIKLVHHLAQRVKDLEGNQCQPNAKCLFKGREYMDQKYTEDAHEPSKLSDR